MNGLKTMALWCRCRWGENCRESIVSCECPEEAPYGSSKIPMDANPATSHMFIVSPLSGGGI